MSVRFQSPNEQFFDSNGDPLSAGTLTFSVTGTSTPLDTYSDNALTTPNTNPVVLDSAGRAGNIFLGNASYKVILKNSGGATIWTADPVLGGPANSLFSTITTKSGNYTLQTSDNGALLEFTATATLTMLASATLGSGFRVGVGNASSGIVTINRAGADTFDTGMTSIKLAPGQSVLIQPDGVSKLYTVGRDKSGKGADIASASTLNLGEDGDYFHVTGTTTITAVEPRPTGTEITLEFDAALTLTHNATSFILPTGANIVTAAGDVTKFISESDGGNWRCASYYTTINKRPEDTAPDLINDFIPFYDVSTNTEEKVKPRNLGLGILDKTGATNTISGTAVETSLYSKLIAANSIGTNGAVRLTLRGFYINNTGAARTFILRIKFGGTTLYDDASPSIATSALSRLFSVQLILCNRNATNVQDTTAFVSIGNIVAATTGVGDFATATLIDALVGNLASAIDTTADQTLDITIQHSAADTTISRGYAVLELI